MKVFLDTCAWIELLHEERLGMRRNLLYTVRAGFVTVLTDVYVIGQLARRFQHETEYQYFVLEATAHQVLFPTDFRLALELARQRSLHDEEAIMPSGDLLDRMLSLTRKDWKDVGDKTNEEAREMFLSWVDGMPHLKRGPGSLSREEKLHQWTTIKENYRDATTAASRFHWENRLPVIKWADLSANFCYNAAWVARMIVEILENWAPTQGDEYDQTILADAMETRCLFLVTDDKKLTRMAWIAREKLRSSPAPITFEDFCRRVELIANL
jgi:predicted nucleic acid-binding protein